MRFGNKFKAVAAAIAIGLIAVPVIATVTVTCNGVTVTGNTSASCNCVNGDCTTTVDQPQPPRAPVCFTIFGNKYCF